MSGGCEDSETLDARRKGGKVMGMIKRGRGKGDSMWAQEINVEDKDK